MCPYVAKKNKKKKTRFDDLRDYKYDKCMLAVLTELHPYVPLSVTLIVLYDMRQF